MVGGNDEAGRALWDGMVQRKLDAYVICGPASERLLRGIYRRWFAALTSSSPPDLRAPVPPTVTVASDNLVMGVDPGLLTVAAPLEGRLS